MKPKDKRNLRMKGPEINLSVNGQMLFKKGVKTVQWGKDRLSTNGAEKTRNPHTLYHIQKLTQHGLKT